MEWQSQLTLVAAITMLAVISPGPDFAVTTRNSLIYGRRAGLATAAGIAAGISVHICYTLLGLGYLMSQAVGLLELMRYLGAAYLVWLGVSSLRPGSSEAVGREGAGAQGLLPLRQAFGHGFLSNALNPKTALFFIALFSQVVDPATSLQVQGGFGLFIALAHLLWFALVALLLTHVRCKRFFDNARSWIERLVGVCLLGLGIKVALGS
ncbi:LysE family transporter [Marinobacterium arenosum]|uniref:LysE family transporter n=1 Tax=Marinobacterium arenosum TaxID=2862496 RepID=UPI001C9797A8|nr:LysE family transporter [Marinobacterium arenosum]MBY4678662.1 LysE family transporter [Marinobacterium arenosum]